MKHYLLEITIAEKRFPFCTFEDYFWGDYIPTYLVRLCDGCATVLFDGDNTHNNIGTLVEGYILGFEFASGETIAKRRAVIIGDENKINCSYIKIWVEKHFEKLISNMEVISNEN